MRRGVGVGQANVQRMQRDFSEGSEEKQVKESRKREKRAGARVKKILEDLNSCSSHNLRGYSLKKYGMARVSMTTCLERGQE